MITLMNLSQKNIIFLLLKTFLEMEKPLSSARDYKDYKKT